MTKDYLIHHGVKGMKWGVRKDPNRSFKGNLHRALAKNYEINERFYSKHTNNKALASMNANAKREQLKKAKAADKVKKDKALAKNEQYRSKLANRAFKKGKKYERLSAEQTRKAKDVDKYGLGSQEWKNHVNRQTNRAVHNSILSGKSYTSTLMTAAASNSMKYNTRQNAIYSTDLKLNAAENKRISTDWMNNHKNLMNMKIDSTTSKREIKKQYTGRRLNRLRDSNLKYVR